jgi:hypothetical protein
MRPRGEREEGEVRPAGGTDQGEDFVDPGQEGVPSFEGKRRPGTVADQSFEPLSVGGLDADAAVQAEPARIQSSGRTSTSPV